MAQHGKKYLEAAKKVEKRFYTPAEAMQLVKEIAFAGFDETVEIHTRLGVDPRHSDQQVRSTVLLPHGLGKTVRVLVFTEGDGIKFAQDGGADLIADEELMAKIENEGWMDFDTAIATPSAMRTIGKLGKVLGRRGLMPNPKSGTVVAPEDLPRAITEARAGKVAYRTDKTANVHVPVGKVSFDADKLVENMAAFMESLRVAKPATSKGTYLRRCVITTTMGPSIDIDPNIALMMGGHS